MFLEDGMRPACQVGKENRLGGGSIFGDKMCRTVSPIPSQGKEKGENEHCSTSSMGNQEAGRREGKFVWQANNQLSFVALD
jgi:hypothetical protein